MRHNVLDRIKFHGSKLTEYGIKLYDEFYKLDYFENEKTIFDIHEIVGIFADRKKWYEIFAMHQKFRELNKNLHDQWLGVVIKTIHDHYYYVYVDKDRAIVLSGYSTFNPKNLGNGVFKRNGNWYLQQEADEYYIGNVYDVVDKREW